MAELRDYLELVRARASLTVVGDTLAGIAASGRPMSPRLAGLPVASVLLYSAGMALNDVADARLDALERPERPIPSGRISRRRGLAVAAGLTICGLGAAALAGGRASFAVALPLAGALWTYDVVAKSTVAGPAVMASCRALDVMMGAGAGRLRPVLPAAAGLAAHTAAVTSLSRGEVHGTTSGVARSTVGTTVAVVGAVLTGAVAVAVGAAGRRSSTALGLAGLAVSALGAGRYATTVLPAQVAAARTLDAPSSRDATRSGICAMIPLQAALSAGAGHPGVGLALLGLDSASTAVLARPRRGGDVT